MLYQKVHNAFHRHKHIDTQTPTQCMLETSLFCQLKPAFVQYFHYCAVLSCLL